MQPRTSVRQPVIAAARRQQLSELLRQWRRQPRKRSPLLFWALLSLALMSDSGLLVLAARSLGVWETATPSVERLVCEHPSDGLPAARRVQYSSLLAAGFLAAAVAVKLRRPQWYRRFTLAGLLSSLGCLGWLAMVLFGQAVPEGKVWIAAGNQGILWSAAIVLFLGLSLTALSREAFFSLTGALVSSLGFLAAGYWPSALAEPWSSLPQGTADDVRLHVQVLLLLSAYAALALAWGMAVLTLARILLAAPSSDRLHRLAALSLWPIRLAVLSLAGSALLDGWRAIPGFFDFPLHTRTHVWNAQMLGTLLVLPGCIALIYARQRGWLPPFRWLAAVALGFPFLAVMGCALMHWWAGDLPIASLLVADVGLSMASLFLLSLTTHAALRYYFGRQRILEV